MCQTGVGLVVVTVDGPAIQIADGDATDGGVAGALGTVDVLGAFDGDGVDSGNGILGFVNLGL